jgi:hypothetical protein
MFAVSCSQDLAEPADTVKTVFGPEAALNDRILGIEAPTRTDSSDEVFSAADRETQLRSLYEGVEPALRGSRVVISDSALSDESASVTFQLETDQTVFGPITVALRTDDAAGWRITWESFCSAIESLGLICPSAAAGLSTEADIVAGGGEVHDEASDDCRSLETRPELLARWGLTEDLAASSAELRLYNNEDGLEVALMSGVSPEVLGGAFVSIGLVDLAGRQARLETADSGDPRSVTTRAVYLDDDCGAYGVTAIGLTEDDVRAIVEGTSLG